MPALLIIDMQIGLFQAAPRHDAQGVVDRINTLAEAFRDVSWPVVFVQHDGPEGDVLEPGTPGWKILDALNRMPEDPVVRKTACDAFYQTPLNDMLRDMGVSRLVLTGCATDFCVDTSVRAAASLDFRVHVASDCHTTADRPHLDAATIITHHNFLWANLILPRASVTVLPAHELIQAL